ncbi:MAG: 30S ribosomal protein S12 methylthiotransferase RimO [Pseudobdellovibrionaceae bacterium]|nr:30S ribosomal protein S12 methylthiotransferase RimO [Pseudobdellovibrionaceae bacterium]
MELQQKEVGLQQKETVNIISLGCPKNLVDSEIMAGSLIKEGYQWQDDPEKAQTVIINTCGFIEDSKRESIQKILEIARLKEEGKVRRIVVAGCLAQRYKNELVESLPEADLFIGSGDFPKIVEILRQHDRGVNQKTYFSLPTYLQQDGAPRVNSQPRHRAYLKISEGCLKRCAFCAIPLIRGNLQSRTIQSIVSEARLLVAGGVKELIIVSHDFTDYGWDLRRKNGNDDVTPERLLEELAQIEGLWWIRLMYLYPDGITPKMLEVIKRYPKICRYFDMPLQHVNDEMLKRMNRKMTKSQIAEVICGIRRELPDATIRTQFIVGYPGETEAQFHEILDFLQQYRFDRVGCFKYSAEENTPAGKMKDQIDEDTKERRYRSLMKLQQKMSKLQNQKLIGKKLPVLVEGYSEETELLLQGRYEGQAPDIDGVVLINEGTAQVGEFVTVEVTKAFEYDLMGRIVQ